jgi:hypothetical protein
MSTELQCRSQHLILSAPSSLPTRLTKEGIPKELLLDQYKSSDAFRMPRAYKVLDSGVSLWVSFGNIFNVVRVMWIWLACDLVIASVTSAVMALPSFGIFYAISLTRH